MYFQIVIKKNKANSANKNYTKNRIKRLLNKTINFENDFNKIFPIFDPFS